MYVYKISVRLSFIGLGPVMVRAAVLHASQYYLRRRRLIMSYNGGSVASADDLQRPSNPFDPVLLYRSVASTAKYKTRKRSYFELNALLASLWVQTKVLWSCFLF